MQSIHGRGNVKVVNVHKNTLCLFHDKMLTINFTHAFTAPRRALKKECRAAVHANCHALVHASFSPQFFAQLFNKCYTQMLHCAVGGGWKKLSM